MQPLGKAVIQLMDICDLSIQSSPSHSHTACKHSDTCKPTRLEGH